MWFLSFDTGFLKHLCFRPAIIRSSIPRPVVCVLVFLPVYHHAALIPCSYRAVFCSSSCSRQKGFAELEKVLVVVGLLSMHFFLLAHLALSFTTALARTRWECRHSAPLLPPWTLISRSSTCGQFRMERRSPLLRSVIMNSVSRLVSFSCKRCSFICAPVLADMCLPFIASRHRFVISKFCFNNMPIHSVIG